MPEFFVATIPVPYNLTLGNFDAFMEKLQELAGAEVSKTGANGIPEEVLLTLQENDLWDAYVTARQIEENVAGYLDVQIRIPKPEPMKEGK